ncbi:MAG TPA: DUF885 domain-containing protein [Pseudonocardiaceae bacterium]|nr:DUF885 domain-containing protein [Pseudonocardiaceae bacterium]
MNHDPASDQIAAYLDWYFDRNPVHADALGAPGYSHRLGDFSPATFDSREREAAQWVARFEAEPARIDRDLVVSALRGELLMAGWPAWRRDPSVYLTPVFAGLLLPFLHRLHPEPDLVNATVSRLAELPGVLASCRSNLDPTLSAPRLVRRALGQAAAGPAFLRDSLPAEVSDPALRTRLVDAAGPAVVAFEETSGFLADLAERATGDWRMGDTLYSALLEQRELLDYGAGELHRRGVAAWDELDAQMRELAPRVPGGSSDWWATMATLQDDHPPTLAAMRAEYAAETARARAFLADRELVTFAEGEQCRVVPAPPFQRSILAVASYLQPPALTRSRTGHFFVPFPPDGATEEETTQRLRTNARAQLPTISVHEAYPGHHWQLSWSADRAPAVRAVHRSSYFAEGWALYAEGMMREQGYYTDPAHELAHLDFRIFRAARIVVDTALHCQDMEPAQAEQFMATRASLSPGTAKAEVDRYCAWPTQAPSYLTGCLEIEHMRAQWTGSLREFHDTLAGSGCLPLGLARRALASGS